MPFINAKTNGSQHDFEGYVDHEHSFNSNQRNYFFGKVGRQTVANDSTVSMMWETGYSEYDMVEGKVCHYDMLHCYKSKTVPVIFSTNVREGYTTGGNTV